VGPLGAGVWKYNRRGWRDFSRFVRYELGNGYKVRFWHDLWCGEQPLKVSYPNLFSFALCKDAWAVDHIQFGNGKSTTEYIIY
jgi:hypothetical protein